MGKGYRIILYLGITTLLITVVCWLVGFNEFLASLSVLCAVCIALGLGGVPSLKTFAYTAWIIVAIVCGMLYPKAFLQWGELDLQSPWLILIVVQIVMFGMGTQMSIQDFKRIRSLGKGVVVGILCQFTLMPIFGYLLTVFFSFTPEIAAGVVLIGSCSSGLASNVMSYLAKANLTLSITLTAVATLFAPIMTPFWMKMLAGTYVEIDFMAMCIQIIKIVIVPIGAALLFDALNKGSIGFRNGMKFIALGATVWLFGASWFWSFLSLSLAETPLELLVLANFLVGAVLFGYLFYHLNKWLPTVLKWMPFMSMVGIVYFTVVTTAASRDNLMNIGIFLLAAAILHNTLGYTFGYWISRLLGLDKNSSRTVALEVGMQNGGMASGLAGVMGKLSTLGLAAAVFSPWMNISGSILANYWRKRPMKPNKN
ncbi:bile acid:sodium symporter family protein [Galbibacter sp.]|uniref:bile acid:sodium symporter family protein n=1 Tax=Galbibacter sp. TaxID=2918471 RepID=UPI003A91035D